MKVVQLICNHQVLVRFRLGAPKNQTLRPFFGVAFLLSGLRGTTGERQEKPGAVPGRSGHASGYAVTQSAIWPAQSMRQGASVAHVGDALMLSKARRLFLGACCILATAGVVL